MAEKHKSKYKAPKDFEKSLKTPTRKDLKDYTHDDKDGGMNPYSTKEMQDLVLRKVDKEVIDNIQNMVPEIKHRVYQDVKTGKYSQKEAKKIFKKLQIEDSESYLEPAQSIEEGVIAMSLQEKKLRSLIRKKIAKVLLEQPSPTDTETPPTETPPTDTETPPTETPPTETPPTDTETPPTETPPTETPPTDTAPKSDNEVIDQTSQTINKFKALLDNEIGVVGKLKILFKVIKSITKDADRVDKFNLLRLLKSTAEKEMHSSKTNPTLKK